MDSANADNEKQISALRDALTKFYTRMRLTSSNVLEQVEDDIRVYIRGDACPDANYKINKLFLELQNRFGFFPTCPFVTIDPCIVGALTTQAKNELLQTVRTGNLAALQLLANRYGWQTIVQSRSRQGRTPLHIACRNGHLKVVKCLLAHGSDANARNLFNATPLHAAAWNGSTAIIAEVVAAGGDVHTQTKPVTARLMALPQTAESIAAAAEESARTITSFRRYRRAKRLLRSLPAVILQQRRLMLLLVASPRSLLAHFPVGVRHYVCQCLGRLWLLPTRHWLEVLLRVGTNTANTVLTSCCQGYSSTDTSPDGAREHVPSLTAALAMLDCTREGETTNSGVWEEESSDDDEAWGWDEDEDDSQDVGHTAISGEVAGADIAGGTDAGGAVDDNLDGGKVEGGTDDVQD